MQCVRCGSANPDGNDVRFCRTCGAELSAPVATATVASRAADAYMPVPLTPTTDGASGQASPEPQVVSMVAALPAPQLLAAVAVPPAAPVLPVAASVSARPAAPAPGLVQVSVSPFGGFWIRLVAWLIDLVILVGTDIIAFIALAFVTATVVSFGDAELDSNATAAVFWLIAFAVPIPYWLLFPPLLGGTPGKLMLGYRVVDDHGKHVSLKRSLGRMLAQIPSAMVLGLGYVWIGFDSRKQGWHDQIAKTFVVRKEVVRS
jgi:uncharacterized RDD family membrane protein YckC